MRKISCELDSLEAVRLVLLTQAPEFHVHGAVIADIRFHLSGEWQVEINDVYHESKFCAGELTKRRNWLFGKALFLIFLMFYLQTAWECFLFAASFVAVVSLFSTLPKFFL